MRGITEEIIEETCMQTFWFFYICSSNQSTLKICCPADTALVHSLCRFHELLNFRAIFNY